MLSCIFQLILNVQNLPSITNGGYQCAFHGYGVTRVTGASVTGGMGDDQTKVQCETPADNLLPPIPTGKGECKLLLQLLTPSDVLLTEKI